MPSRKRNTNTVEILEFLKQNEKVAYSLHKISKKTGIKKNLVSYFCRKNENIRRVSNIEIGSGKSNIFVFKYLNTQNK